MSAASENNRLPGKPFVLHEALAFCRWCMKPREDGFTAILFTLGILWDLHIPFKPYLRLDCHLLVRIQHASSP